MSKVAVVIPNHKEEIDPLEKISLAQCRKVLKNHPIVFVAPEGKNFSYIKPDEFLMPFPPKFFQNTQTYSQLLMSPFFYKPFLSFDYMLIYQLDAFVFYDALEDFCWLGYDYIGAPWPYYSWQGSKVGKKTPRSGNGGFCLRKVKACYELLTEASRLPSYKNALQKFDEDAFFAACGVLEETKFNVAPVEVANLFAMEWYPERHVKKLGYELPFGCHHWNKFSPDFYTEIFAQFGYDLRPFRNLMSNDYYEALPGLLIKLALARLIRRAEHGQPLLQYLPTKNFSSVRVIRSPDAMKILTRLVADENFLTDKIFIYDEKDFRNLIRDVTRADLPHLVICTDYDKSLIGAIEHKGLTYGEHIISFRQEYLKVQEKFFHNLGR